MLREGKRHIHTYMYPSASFCLPFSQLAPGEGTSEQLLLVILQLCLVHLVIDVWHL